MTNATSHRTLSAAISRAMRVFFTYVLLALLCAILPPVSYAQADNKDASKNASERSASSQGSAGVDVDESDAEPDDAYLDALASCVDGIFAGWGVSDSAGFFESDLLDPANGTSAWLAFDVYRAGLTDGSDAYVKRMESYVTESYAGKEHGLDQRAPTTWARTAIIASAFGRDPAAFGNDAEGQPANLLSDGIFNWSYTDNLGDQGSNAWIYALQAVDAAKVKAPKNAKYTEADLIKHILACQAKDGSFALIENSKTGSVDLTGMALTALGPHKDDPGVMQAIEAAVAYLSELWWPGFTFCDPSMTRRLIDGIAYDNVGIMLDTGHLLNTNTKIRTQAQAAKYILDRFEEHGDLREKVRGLHLHQSLSGQYVESACGRIPEEVKGSYEERFAYSYEHILKIDPHDPWTDPIIADTVRTIGPEWVNNELYRRPRTVHEEVLAIQMRALSGK